jgi:hypothetical protein
LPVPLDKAMPSGGWGRMEGGERSLSPHSQNSSKTLQLCSCPRKVCGVFGKGRKKKVNEEQQDAL